MLGRNQARASRSTAGGRAVISQPVMAPSRPANTGTVLLYAFKAFDAELFAALGRAGHVGLRSAHGAVLANLDAVGTRGSTLARRAGIGTSAMGELVDDLEALGYVARAPDPLDRRAKLVVPTPAGSAVIHLAAETIGKIERRYVRRLGKERYETFRSALIDIACQSGAPV